MTNTSQPGYRRRIRIEPRDGAVAAMLEDDMHCLAVILRHDGKRVISVESETHRMPWTTCPGAAAKLVETFAGLPLAEVTSRRDKKQNCTHLHDLAVLAAAHALDRAPLEYRISASDPVGGRRLLDLTGSNGLDLHWDEQDGVLAVPPSAAGIPLMALREWISSLPEEHREPARLLQWASLVAHGRTMPLEDQSNAAELPPNCYTFQPARAVLADRVGARYDFSNGSREPLSEIADGVVARL
ncbi:MAG: DUF2889 domain-containing protein [Novosphingobium sp.]